MTNKQNKKDEEGLFLGFFFPEALVKVVRLPSDFKGKACLFFHVAGKILSFQLYPWDFQLGQLP